MTIPVMFHNKRGGKVDAMIRDAIAKSAASGETVTLYCASPEQGNAIADRVKQLLTEEHRRHGAEASITVRWD